MYSIKVALILVALQSCHICITSAQCTLNIQTDLGANDPIFLNDKGELWTPSGPNLVWEKGSSTPIICSGSKNYFNKTKVSLKTISCDKQNRLLVDGKSYNKNDTSCGRAISGDIQISTKKCGKVGNVVDVGFETEKYGFVKLFDICFDTQKGIPIYTHHVIKGVAAKYAASDSSRPQFKVTGIAKHVDPAKSYTQKIQLERFATLLGDTKYAAKFLNSTSYLARGHLTPDHDGIFKSWQSATYFYMNVAPEWQVINGGNWVRIENAARAKATELNDDLEVYTGVYGVAQLKNKAGKMIDVFLEENNQVPVPQYYWKILKHNDDGIGFATVNNPFEEDTKPICKDICAETGWAYPNFALSTKGTTVCCKVADLMKAIKDIPKEAKVKNVLKY